MMRFNFDSRWPWKEKSTGRENKISKLLRMSKSEVMCTLVILFSVFFGKFSSHRVSSRTEQGNHHDDGMDD